MSEQPTQPALDRTEAWSQVNHTVEQLVAAAALAAQAHANDVATLAQSLGHLAAVLDLAAERGWESSWSLDNAKLEAARKFLADLNLEETDHGNPS